MSTSFLNINIFLKIMENSYFIVAFLEIRSFHGLLSEYLTFHRLHLFKNEINVFIINYLEEGQKLGSATSFLVLFPRPVSLNDNG